MTKDETLEIWLMHKLKGTQDKLISIGLHDGQFVEIEYFTTDTYHVHTTDIFSDLYPKNHDVHIEFDTILDALDSIDYNIGSEEELLKLIQEQFGARYAKSIKDFIINLGDEWEFGWYE